MSASTLKTMDASSEGTRFSKVEAETATEILERYDPSDDATALVQEGMSPVDFFDTLVEKGLVPDALTFLAYGLPPREALLWGLRCVREVTPEEPPEEIANAIAAADAWITEPDEDRRYAAFPAAEAAAYETPAGCLALAVYFSGGSMAPADCPAVPVGEWFCSRTVAAAIHVCYLGGDPEKADETARGFVDLGLAVANEPAPWEEEGG